MIRDTISSSTCRMREKLKKIRSSEAAQHFWNAQREMLLAAKSVIEIGLSKIEDYREEREKEETETQARKVDIT